MLGEIVAQAMGGGGGEEAAAVAAAAAAAAPAALLSAGVVVGLAHALDPDHVAAVLASGHGRAEGRQKGKAAPLRIKRALSRGSLLGALWGAGHTSAILLVALGVLAFSLSIPGAVFDGLEAAVGLMLVALGVSAWTGTGMLGLWRRMRGRWERGGGGDTHPHSHAGGTVHTHPHSHAGGTVHTHPHSHDGGGGDWGGAHRHGHRSYLIGCVHGLAGSGGLIALGASAMGSMEAGIAMVLAFGAGSVAGMMLASGTLSLPFAFAARLDRAKRAMRAGIGIASMAIGVAIVAGVAAGAL